jgi:integrase
MSGVIPINGNVFLTNYGHMIESQQVNRAIKSCIERLAKKGIAIDHFTAHGLRDTFATRAIESGMNPQTLKTILGHNSLEMTMDLYAHVMPDTKAEEMNKLQLIHIG